MAVDADTRPVEKGIGQADRPQLGIHPAGPPRPISLAVHLLLLAALLVTGVGYIQPFMYRGWIPHDEGLIAHSAERVLEGQLPHRDFHDAYTGGLTYLHAAAFKAFGMRLTSLRLALLASYVIMLFGLYYIAVRHTSWWIAMLCIACCVTWSMPNYFASLPSWYILAAAVVGTALLMQYQDSRHCGWLVAAGLCGGVAILMKIIGLYFVAAGLLFILYTEQEPTKGEVPNEGRGRNGGYVAFTVLIGAALIGLLLLLLRNDLRPMELLYFVAPTFALCCFLVINERRKGRAGVWRRFGRLCVKVSWFAGGVAAPLFVFSIPFLLQGSISDLLHGVLVLPQARLESAKQAWQSWPSLLPVVIPAVLMLPTCFRWPKQGLWLVGAMLVLVAILLALSLTKSIDLAVVYFSIRGLLPVLVACTCIVLLQNDRLEQNQRMRADLFLLACMASLLFLVQYPASYLIYFCYCAPLVLLLLHNLWATHSRTSGRWVYVGLVTTLALFGALRLNTVFGVIESNSVSRFRAPLELERGGLLVDDAWRNEYDAVIETVNRHADPGEFIYAAPDCPEIYFLANRKNPTPTMFDFFDEPKGRTERIMGQLRDKRVDIVVVNEHPYFSKPISGDLAEKLKQEYPVRERIGHFVVGRREITR